MTGPALPADWVARVSAYPGDGGPTGADWVATVPRLVDEAIARWDLKAVGPVMTGWTAAVVPVERDGQRLALKIGWPHADGVHEALVLRHWAGTGAVRLVAAEPASGLLLLEWLDPSRDLRTPPVDEACAVIGGLLSRLNVPAPPQLPRITQWLAPHLERMATRPAVPRRVVDRTRGLARELLSGPVPELLLHTDLHFENVLSRGDEWVAIDPKPVAGHPGFELLPLVMNRFGELGDRTQAAAHRRVISAAEAAGMDLDEAFAWTRLRAGIEVSWAAALGDATELSHAITAQKALDD